MGECFFRYRPTRVVPDQRPLNGRCCCCGTQHGRRAYVVASGTFVEPTEWLRRSRPAARTSTTTTSTRASCRSVDTSGPDWDASSELERSTITHNSSPSMWKWATSTVRFSRANYYYYYYRNRTHSTQIGLHGKR